MVLVVAALYCPIALCNESRFEQVMASIFLQSLRESKKRFFFERLKIEIIRWSECKIKDLYSMN